MNDRKTYPPEAVAVAECGALEWLEGNKVGFPRSWAQEAADIRRRGYDLYDEYEAPPIAGYEALEAKGLVVRGGISKLGCERVRFDLKEETK